MCGGEVLHAQTNHLSLRWRSVQGATGEDLTTGLTEVLRQKGVEDGVDTGVSIGQAVGDDSENKRGVIQREKAKLHPHGDDVVGHPADGEGGDDQKDCLSRLRENKVKICQWVVYSILFNSIPLYL